LEVFLTDGFLQLQGKRVGLVTNASGVNRQLRSTIDLLFADQRLHLQALFAPEHGILGNVQAGVEVAEQIDARTGLPLYSLFGSSLQSHQPTQNMLQGLDALIYDIQDVGARYYTYTATMAYAQEAAAAAGLDFIVFDRPNPITGHHREGNLLDSAFASLVGVHPIPIRHGLTSGELARLFAAERGYPPPTVLAMRGWQRSAWFDETSLPWVQPSPNLPTLDSALLYPGTCLLEGTTLSEGRGTTRPFELFGAPWLNPFLLREILEQLALPGVAFRPASFTPTFSKYAHTLCHGLQLHILDRESIRPVALTLYILATVRQLHPDDFSWLKNEDGGYLIDRLFGSDRPRLAFDAGTDVVTIMADWPSQIASFQERCRTHWIYEPEG
jgi:uncharacterized protein YbbC (DUF1343 family)